MRTLPTISYINLDRDEDRRRRIEAEMARAGLTGTRIQGVDGALGLPEDLANYFAHHRLGREPLLAPGALGCYASHLRTFRQIVASQAPVSLVLEDDAILDDDIGRVLEDTLAVLPEGWDFVHVSQAPDRAFRPLCRLACGRSLVRYSRIPFGTAGYLISAAGAAKFLNPDVARIWPIDTDTRRAWIFGIDAYGVLPPPIRQNKGIPSTIKKRGGRHRLRSGLLRPTALTWSNNPFRTPQSLAFNLAKLGPAWWLRCFASNSVLKIRTTLGRPFRRKPVRVHPVPDR